MSTRVFVDVDTLGDFFGGALPVPNADEIRPTLAKINKLAKDEGITVLKFNDCHDGSEPEMICNGGPFPLHCIEESDGAASIRETANKRAVIFSKKTYNIFDKKLGNDKIDGWLKENEVTEAWVYGVATDWCVKAAVLGLIKRGIRVYVFENAIMGIDEKTTQEAIDMMKKAGALFAVAKL